MAKPLKELLFDFTEAYEARDFNEAAHEMARRLQKLDEYVENSVDCGYPDLRRILDGEE